MVVSSCILTLKSGLYPRYQRCDYGSGDNFLIKDEREGTIRNKMVILGYLAFLFLYRIVIQLVAPISSGQMGAALNIFIPL